MTLSELKEKYNIYHRDIKPENIYINNKMDFILGDFGEAKLTEQTIAMYGTVRGTRMYMSPELYIALKEQVN